MGVDLVLIVVGGLARWLAVLLLVVVPATTLVVIVVVVGVSVVILLGVSLVPRLLRWWLLVTVIVIADLSSWSIPLLWLVFSLLLVFEMATSNTCPAVVRLRRLAASALGLVVLVIASSTTIVASLIPRWVPLIALWFVIIGVVFHWSSRTGLRLLVLLLLVS